MGVTHAFMFGDDGFYIHIGDDEYFVFNYWCWLWCVCCIMGWQPRCWLGTTCI